jgi:hypothetical protein
MQRGRARKKYSNASRRKEAIRRCILFIGAGLSYTLEGHFVACEYLVLGRALPSMAWGEG